MGAIHAHAALLASAGGGGGGGGFDPGTLFTGGQMGFWWETTGYSNLYQDFPPLATPVTAAGQNIKGWEDLSGNAIHGNNTLGTYPKSASFAGVQCVRLEVDNSIRTTSTNLLTSMDFFLACYITSTGQYLVAWDGVSEVLATAQSGSGSPATLNAGGLVTYYVDGTAVAGGTGVTRDTLWNTLPRNTWTLLEVRDVNLFDWDFLKIGHYGYGYDLSCYLRGAILCPSQTEPVREQIRQYMYDLMAS